MSFLSKAISRLFTKRYLLITNTVGSGVLMGLGDLSVQLVEKRHRTGHFEVDYHRLGRLFVLGLGMGPPLHFWYKILDHRFPVVNAISVARKVLLDQMIASPLFITYFFIVAGLLEGRSFKSSVQELKEKFITVFMVDIAVWPAAQTINFFFLPPRFRVIYVASLALVYDMFLSIMKHVDAAQELVHRVNDFILNTIQRDKKH